MFDISKLINVEFYDKTFSETITLLNLQEQYSHTNLDLYMYNNNLSAKRYSSIIAKMFTKIANNKIEIIDFLSKYEEQGNGKVLLMNLLKCIIIINSDYPIKTIWGWISPQDFNHWDKLLHIYSSLNKYAYEFNIPITVKFRLKDNIAIEYFLTHKNLYESIGIYFYCDIIFP